MERYLIRSGILGFMSCLIFGAYGIDFESEYEKLFIDNKTNHEVVVHFCNEDHKEQQQYPMRAKEHRFVNVKAGVMKKLAMVQVTMKDSQTKKKISKEIDYRQNEGIVGLEITLKPSLDLIWRHEEEYAVNVPSEG